MAAMVRSLTSSFDLDTILRTILEHMERIIEAILALLILDRSAGGFTTRLQPAVSRRLSAAFASKSVKAPPAGSPNMARPSSSPTTTTCASIRAKPIRRGAVAQS